MRFGLRAEDLKYIKEVLSRFPEVEKAVIFGSRAKGTFKPGSDVDLALWGNRINFTTIARLQGLLADEGPLPYFFDIVDYNQLENEELRQHINRVGQLIYSRVQ